MRNFDVPAVAQHQAQTDDSSRSGRIVSSQRHNRAIWVELDQEQDRLMGAPYSTSVIRAKPAQVDGILSSRSATSAISREVGDAVA
ncbi:hypothetical protein QFZ26_002190 [Agromyces ramosus]|uniref:Uncharacterized protein n=1 Tax=Agromyces ramosus TaxID=33879 RepID=A0ABU0R980_9MICO|nr:hypothetical protein [Agromyces ramosus]